MDKEERGIQVERLIQAESQREGKHFHEAIFLAVKAVILLLAGLGVTKGFVDTFLIPVQPWLLYTSVVFLCILYAAIFSFPQKIKITLPVWIVIFAVFCISFHGIIGEGFKCIYNQAVEQINSYYDMQVPLAAVSAADTEQAASVFVILAILLGILGCGIVYYLDARVTALVMTFPLALALAVGLFVKLDALLLMASSLVGVFFLQNTKIKDSISSRVVGVSLSGGLLSKLRWQTAVFAAAMMLLLAPLGCLWIGPAINEGYENQSELREDIRSGELVNSMRDFWKKLVRGEWDWLPFDIIRSSGVHGGKLSNVKEIRDYNDLHLYLDISNELYAPLYIRGYVGSNYTGRGWKGQTDDQKQESLAGGMSAGEISRMYYNQLEQLQQRELAEEGQSAVYGRLRFVITNKDANSAYSYIPYGTDFSEFETGSDYDVYPGEKTDENILNLYYINTQKLSNLAALEAAGAQNTEDAAYRQYARQAYLTLPTEGMDEFYAEYQNLQFASVTDCVAFVRENLMNHAVYTKAPGATPKGKDYVSYFLYENKQGACTHFASAAVLMFRMFGIPSRYVEGYLTTSLTANQGANEIRDNCAHAWPEIYLDGIGWLPVEVTPGFLNEEDMRDDREDSNLHPNELPDVQNTEEETLPQETQEASEEEVQNSASDEPTTAPDLYVVGQEPTQPQPSASEPADKNNNNSEFLRYIIRIILAIAAVIGVLCLILLFIRMRYRRQLLRLEKGMNSGEPKKGIRIALAAIERLTREEGLELDETTDRQEALAKYSVLDEETLFWLQSLCLEAGFSRHTFDEDTREAVSALYRQLAAQALSEKKGISRLVFRYLKCFI